jgi:hypothetical protein
VIIDSNSILVEDILGRKAKIIHNHKVVKDCTPEVAPPVVTIGLSH